MALSFKSAKRVSLWILFFLSILLFKLRSIFRANSITHPSLTRLKHWSEASFGTQKERALERRGLHLAQYLASVFGGQTVEASNLSRQLKKLGYAALKQSKSCQTAMETHLCLEKLQREIMAWQSQVVAVQEGRRGLASALGSLEPLVESLGHFCSSSLQDDLESLAIQRLMVSSIQSLLNQRDGERWGEVLSQEGLRAIFSSMPEQLKRRPSWQVTQKSSEMALELLLQAEALLTHLPWRPRMCCIRYSKKQWFQSWQKHLPTLSRPWSTLFEPLAQTQKNRLDQRFFLLEKLDQDGVEHLLQFQRFQRSFFSRCRPLNNRIWQQHQQALLQEGQRQIQSGVDDFCRKEMIRLCNAQLLQLALIRLHRLEPDFLTALVPIERAGEERDLDKIFEAWLEKIEKSKIKFFLLTEDGSKVERLLIDELRALRSWLRETFEGLEALWIQDLELLFQHEIETFSADVWLKRWGDEACAREGEAMRAMEAKISVGSQMMKRPCLMCQMAAAHDRHKSLILKGSLLKGHVKRPRENRLKAQTFWHSKQPVVRDRWDLFQSEKDWGEEGWMVMEVAWARRRFLSQLEQKIDLEQKRLEAFIPSPEMGRWVFILQALQPSSTGLPLDGEEASLRQRFDHLKALIQPREAAGMEESFQRCDRLG